MVVKLANTTKNIIKILAVTTNTPYTKGVFNWTHGMTTTTKSVFRVHPPKATVRRLANTKGYTLTKHLTLGEGIKWLLTAPKQTPVLLSNLPDTLCFLQKQSFVNFTVVNNAEWQRWLYVTFPQQIVALTPQHYIATIFVPDAHITSVGVQCTSQIIEFIKTSNIGYYVKFSDEKTFANFQHFIALHRKSWYAEQLASTIKTVQEFLEAQHDGTLGF